MTLYFLKISQDLRVCAAVLGLDPKSITTRKELVLF